MKLTIKIKKPDLKFLQRGKNFENIFNAVLIRTSKQLGKEIVKAMRNIMESGEWEPNEPEYAAWKATHGYATEPLFRTTLLAKSIASGMKINLPNSIGGEVGWHTGARYPGNLQMRQWARGVPKRRKKNLGLPTETPRMSHSDTNYLAQVARWNEDGAGQISKFHEEQYQVKNGLTKKGTQKFRMKTRVTKELLRLGRLPRPFVATTREEVADIVYERYVDATRKAFARIYGGKNILGDYSSVPF